MTPEQAVDIIDQVAAKFHGNRQDHILINQAIEVIKDLNKQNENFKQQKTCADIPKFAVKKIESTDIKSAE